ncbi:hypothetical protein CLOSBL3_12867 [Clostridiaceae bacterium BL-3]|nr:hypothetical protein CLOSBL3_12867 [Clostridiaceae bacterium BL-3]
MLTYFIKVYKRNIFKIVYKILIIFYVLFFVVNLQGKKKDGKLPSFNYGIKGY